MIFKNCTLNVTISCYIAHSRRRPSVELCFPNCAAGASVPEKPLKEWDFHQVVVRNCHRHRYRDDFPTRDWYRELDSDDEENVEEPSVKKLIANRESLAARRYDFCIGEVLLRDFSH